MSRPILVTGSHRSGTTWVGRMLCRSRETGYIHEPFNPDRRPGWSGHRIPYWFLYVAPHNEHLYHRVFEDIVAFRYPVRYGLSDARDARRAALFALDCGRSIVYRARRLRPLVKDPIALFSAEWLERRFDMEVVVMVRHPAAFVGSLKRLDWRFKFRGWLAQPALLRDWLSPFEAEMRHCSTHDVDIVEQGIVMWKALHHVIGEYLRRHPSWTFVRHEDLAASPTHGFRRLYDTLGLRWDGRVAAALARHSAAANPSEVARWRHASIRRDSRATVTSWRTRLSPAEIDRVRAGVSGFTTPFYADADWDT